MIVNIIQKDFIDIKHVNKVYKNGVTAIYDLSLKIKKGEFVSQEVLKHITLSITNN